MSAVRSIFDFGAAVSGVVHESNTEARTSTVHAACTNCVWMKLTAEEEEKKIGSVDSRNEDGQISISGLTPGVSKNILDTPIVSTPADQSTYSGSSTFVCSTGQVENNQDYKNENNHEIPKISPANAWESLGIKVPSSNDYYLARVGWFPDGSVMAQVTGNCTNDRYVHSYDIYR